MTLLSSFFKPFLCRRLVGDRLYEKIILLYKLTVAKETFIIKIMKSILKRILPKTGLRVLLRLRDGIKIIIFGIPISPLGTDWTGYEALIEFIVLNNILSVKGDLVEIGALFGGGTYKLSKFLEKRRSLKRLFAIDIFDPSLDETKNIYGLEMANMYRNTLESYKGKSQWEVFSEITRDCNNIIVLKGDSKRIKIPANSLCFGFIDGNHSPDYTENDFYLVWDLLSSKGIIAFHDYEWDLPQITVKIKELVDRHSSKIQKIYHNQNRHILFVIKK